jgi:DNA helicase HerA-like ATPase
MLEPTPNGDSARASLTDDELDRRLAADIAAAGGSAAPAPDQAGAVGVTMFDQPASEDLTVTVLLSRECLQKAPSQSLVRITSRGDGRRYLDVVSAGPFAQPDSLRADSPVLVTVATRGGAYLPPYHGRVQVTLLGEELAGGTLVPPRLRPLPSSPVFALTPEESAALLQAGGDVRLGLAVGHERLEVGIPSERKDVLPRHLGILGTTGGGKSTTVAGLVRGAQAAGMAVILLDVEGEYTHLHEPADDRRMVAALAERGLVPGGVPADRMTVSHLVGRDTANPGHPRRRTFSLQFARLSPYAAMEILGLSDAQQERFLKAYDVAREVMRDLDVFPRKGDAKQERMALELDEFERGYPRMTLSFLIDVVSACAVRADRPEKRTTRSDKYQQEEPEPWRPFTKVLTTEAGRAALQKRLHAVDRPGHPISWRALLGRLGRLNRLRVFDVPKETAGPLVYKDMLAPGTVSVIDLSDTGMTEVNNLVIADLLRGVREAQEEAYADYEGGRGEQPRTLIVVEEAHEFLAAERIDKMATLFQQVARIAKRGRKRRLGLAFVTQLPQHLPRQLLGLLNSYVLHKITDPSVVSALKKTVSGIDEGLWDRLPGLAPGQALVSFPHMTRPLLVSIDPGAAKLRLVD